VQVQQRRSSRPRFRGRLHEIAFFVSIPAGIALVDAGHRAAAYVGAAIFAVSLSAVYGTSAAYHLRSWSPRAERVMKHIDHSMIFVLIAGSFTPIALLALRPSWSVAMVSLAAFRRGGLLRNTCVDRDRLARNIWPQDAKAIRSEHRTAHPWSIQADRSGGEPG
jgi:hypothetical protein